MGTLITVIHVVTAVFIVLLVLLQQGKGAQVSATLSGSSQTIFGSSGGANFFTKLTGGAAAVFMVTSLVLTVMGGQHKKSLFESVGAPAASPLATPGAQAPVAPAEKKK